MKKIRKKSGDRTYYVDKKEYKCLRVFTGYKKEKEKIKIVSTECIDDTFFIVQGNIINLKIDIFKMQDKVISQLGQENDKILALDFDKTFINGRLDYDNNPYDYFDKKEIDEYNTLLKELKTKHKYKYKYIYIVSRGYQAHIEHAIKDIEGIDYVYSAKREIISINPLKKNHPLKRYNAEIWSNIKVIMLNNICIVHNIRKENLHFVDDNGNNIKLAHENGYINSIHLNSGHSVSSYQKPGLDLLRGIIADPIEEVVNIHKKSHNSSVLNPIKPIDQFIKPIFMRYVKISS